MSGMTRSRRLFAAAPVRISSTSNTVRVVAEPRDDIEVDGDAVVDADGAQLTIGRVRSRVTVTVPVGTAVIVGTTSGRAEVEGPVGTVAVATESGRVLVESATKADVRTTSGRVTVGDVVGRCCVKTVSGSISVAACAGGDAATTSGKIDLSQVSGPVRAHCVSGQISLELVAAHDVEAETVSGRVSIVLPPGVRAYRPDATGGPTPDDADCTILARSVSGRVQVVTR